MPDDLQQGIDIAKNRLQASGLRTAKCYPTGSGGSYYLEIALGSNTIDTTIQGVPPGPAGNPGVSSIARRIHSVPPGKAAQCAATRLPFPSWRSAEC